MFRIEAILRRVKGKKGKEVTMYKIGRFTFDTQKQVLMAIDDKVTKLTTKESELLSLLCAHVNEILERNYALKTIWIDDNYFNARSMDVYITKLRKHLKADPSIEIIMFTAKATSSSLLKARSRADALDEPLTMLMAHKQQAWLFRHNCRKAAPAVVKCGGMNHSRP